MQIRVGSRGSPLAIVQTEIVLDRLRVASPADEFMVEVIHSFADKALDAPLAGLPRGIFAKELEAALIEDRIDMAVHSFKDLPIEIDDHFVVGAIVEREDPRDALVSPGYSSLADVPVGGQIGTSSPRRKALLYSLRSDLEVIPVRGNVGTRVEKARSGALSGVVVAAAGLKRLRMDSVASELFDPTTFIPEAGQGALAIEIRAGDEPMARLTERVNHPDTLTAVTAEATTVRLLGGGCTVPIAAHAGVVGDWLMMHGLVSDGVDQLVRADVRGHRANPEALGHELAQRLRDLGAAEMLERAS